MTLSSTSTWPPPPARRKRGENGADGCQASAGTPSRISRNRIEDQAKPFRQTSGGAAHLRRGPVRVRLTRNGMAPPDPLHLVGHPVTSARLRGVLLPHLPLIVA